MASKIQVDKILNVSGLIPPQSNFLIAKTLEEVQQGSVLEIISRERKTMRFIPQLCRDSSCRILETREMNGLLHYTVIKF